MKDINDILPRFPGMRWGALLNWVPEDAEIDQLLKTSPFPDDARWHTIQRDNRNKDNKDVVVDGKTIKRSDESKLT